MNELLRWFFTAQYLGSVSPLDATWTSIALVGAGMAWRFLRMSQAVRAYQRQHGLDGALSAWTELLVRAGSQLLVLNGSNAAVGLIACLTPAQPSAVAAGAASIWLLLPTFLLIGAGIAGAWLAGTLQGGMTRLMGLARGQAAAEARPRVVKERRG